MSKFLDQYKQRLADKLAPPVVESKNAKSNVMHGALVEVVAERVRNQEKIQDLIIEKFGWNAACTPGECKEIWDAAPLREMSDAAAGRRDEGQWTGRNKKAQIQNPAVGEMVIMQGGMGKVVEVDAANGSVIVRNQTGEEKGFPRDQLEGPRAVNNKRAWALKSAMPRG